jgi:hypothetical protein
MDSWRRIYLKTFAGRVFTLQFHRMNEPDEIPPKRNYKWPWFVLAGVLLFVVLAIVWVSIAANRLKQQREFAAPPPPAAK